ncbi:P-loop containing nucleoside triphosphate hydrolase protein [Penicillium angulare]|uniref:P-loop containing nucleoside triphosphate hydrolase protein n=1 Tax=Penicillium angulare TaxID=116970 RepID=A0A9W9EVV4_9EURO|nr:P-loop containing nucleoside triphosphate hydrolase protein [Penicillium angulare]
MATENQEAANDETIGLPVERPETPVPPLSTVPFHRDPDFVDSGSAFSQIYAKATRPGARTAVVGLGGVGKSQLLVELCYRVREQSPETWVFWIHAGNAARFEQSCWDIADRVKIPGRRDPATNIFQLIHDWLVDEENGRWVVVLDNVDDGGFLQEMPPMDQSTSTTSPRKLLKYLPISRNGATIVTSRNRDAVSSIVKDCDIFQVEPMGLSCAVELLEKKLGVQKDQQSEILCQLATALDYMPLAIVQAAAYIKQRQFSAAQYLEEFEKSSRQKESLLSHNDGQLRHDKEATDSILVTCQIIFDHMEETQWEAAHLLSFMSFCDHQGIPEGLLERKNEDFEDIIALLRDYAMVSIGMDGTTVEMHSLVQVAVGKWLEMHGQLESHKALFIHVLWTEFPDERSNFYIEERDLCQSLFPHIRRVFMYQLNEDDDFTLRIWADLLERSAMFALSKGNFAEGEKMAVKSMNVRKKLFGLSHHLALYNMEVAATAYMQQGKWKDAESLEREIVEARTQLGVPEDDTDMMTSLAQLATIYSNLGQLEKAEKLEVRMVEIHKQKSGLENDRTLGCMNNLAMTYEKLERWDEAEKLLQHVADTTQRTLGSKHPNTLTSMDNLASVYSEQGRLEEAEKLQMHVMEIAQEFLGPNHPQMLSILTGLASTYTLQGQLEEAEKLQRRLITTSEQVLGPNHPDTVANMNNLAHTLKSSDQLEDACQLMAECVRILSLTFGPESPYAEATTSHLKEWREILDKQVKSRL